jgi:thioredoxin 2
MTDYRHIACPICAAGGTCGKCGAPLFNRRPVELTTASFDRMINNTDIPVLVDFWAPWCGPCKMMAPIFEQAAQKLEPGVRLAKLNTENEQAIAARYNIRSIPTLALFKNGRVVAEQAGAMNLDGLLAWIRSKTSGSTA